MAFICFLYLDLKARKLSVPASLMVRRHENSGKWAAQATDRIRLNGQGVRDSVLYQDEAATGATDRIILTGWVIQEVLIPVFFVRALGR